MDVGDPHSAIDGLAHVVNGKERNGKTGKSLHFHTRLRSGFRLASARQRRFVVPEGKIDSDMGKENGVAQRDETTRLLRRHDAGDLRGDQRVALFRLFSLMARNVSGFI